MAEYLFKRSDYTHPDPDKDGRGVHKKTDFINWKPDGWRDHPNWTASNYPKDFIVIACPEIPFAEAETNDHRRAWKDDFDYQIVATRPAQGKYDIRIFEKNAGAIGQNKYQVYSRNDLVNLGSKIGGEITATQLLISLSVEGRYYLGVKSVRYPAGETVGIPSVETAWSNVAADTNNNPFGVSYFTAPVSPGGLRLVP
jgi:hypothetical protein